MAVRLFLTSALVLFVELLLIRWVPANVVYVGFFSNFVLMASFLGIGLGIFAGRGSPRSWPALYGPLLLVTVAVIHRARVDLTGPELFFGASDHPELHVDVAVGATIILLVAATMAAVSMPLGGLLRSLPPLRAYALDIAGSLCGIGAFSALALLSAGPTAWLAMVLALTVVIAVVEGPRRASYLGAGAIAAALGLALALDQGDIWSPYNRIGIYSVQGTTSLAVNGLPFQKMWPVAAANKEPYFDQIYEWLPDRRFGSALVVGAGTGTDAAVALARGVSRIEAVEIDPAILALGRDRHPDRPYDDERVHTTLNDGRAFLRSTDERYDLVVFGATDSLTLVTSTANLRLESFLFTEEAFASVRDHLTPTGVFVLYNWYREPWLIERYAAMLERTFGAPPAVRVYDLAGDIQAAALAAGPGLRDATVARPPRDLGVTGVHDDAPFTYLRTRAIPASGLAGLAALLAVAVAGTALVMRTTSTALGRASPHFFLLGAAFLLLETKSLATFSLLFGTTWVVNALVFFAILASVLAAIAVSARFPRRDPRPYYAGLFGTLALGYVVPPAELLLEPAALRYAVASAIAFGPIFFANLVFTHSFRDSRAADVAFASNLLGAMIGGMLEWSAIVIGYRALALVVALLYVAAYLAQARIRLLGDRSLLTEIARPARA